MHVCMAAFKISKECSVKFRCHLYGHWTAKWAHHRPARGFSFLVSEFYFTILHKPNIFVPVNTKCGLAPGGGEAAKTENCQTTILQQRGSDWTWTEFSISFVFDIGWGTIATMTITIQYNKPSPHYNARQQFRAQSRVMIIIIITI